MDESKKLCHCNQRSLDLCPVRMSRIREAARIGFTEIPENCAVMISSWHGLNSVNCSIQDEQRQLLNDSSPLKILAIGRNPLIIKPKRHSMSAFFIAGAGLARSVRPSGYELDELPAWCFKMQRMEIMLSSEV